jgi:CRP/FNR family transcriptional regulator, nitrogen fixation regulation protein
MQTISSTPAAGFLFRERPRTRAHGEGREATVGPVRRYAKDEEIFGEGDRTAYYYKVLEGAVRTSKLLSDGRRQIGAFYLPGDLFGIEAGEEHRFSAEAVGDARIVSYKRCGLDILAANDNDFAVAIVEAMMQALARAQDHMLLLGRKSAIEKIATFLLDFAERLNEDSFELSMSRTDIADHLGLTIETVSRSLSQLERKGYIALPSTRRIELRNKAALSRLDG